MDTKKSASALTAIIFLASLLSAPAMADPDRDLEKALERDYETEKYFNIPLLKKSISEGADVNQGLQKAVDRIPSFETGSYGTKEDLRCALEAVQLLIDAGADVKATGKYGRTMLLNIQSITVAAFLIEKGADVNAWGDGGSSSFHEIIGIKNQAWFDLYIKAGADFNAPDKNGFSPLMCLLASEYSVISSPATKLDEETMLGRLEFLIAKGADVKHESKTGLTPLHLAAYSDQGKAMKLLIASGADPDRAETQYGNTPLHLAVFKGYSGAAKILLDAGADKDKKNKAGLSPYMTAYFSGMDDIVGLLIHAGADSNLTYPSKTVSFGSTDARYYSVNHFRLDQACRKNRSGLAFQALKAGANPDGEGAYLPAPITLTTDKDIIQMLISKGADVNVKCREYGFWGETPLLRAVKAGMIEIAALLLKGGADIHVTDRDGISPLTWATYNPGTEMTALIVGSKQYKEQPSFNDPKLLQTGDPAQLKKLVDAGADVDSHNGMGCTALMLAANKGSLELVKSLVHWGADINARDNTGKTPLMYALHNPGAYYNEKNDTSPVIRFLLSAGADVNAETFRESTTYRHLDPVTPLSFALQSGYESYFPQMMKIAVNISIPLLIKSGANTSLKRNYRWKSFAETPLSLAADIGNADMVRLLIKAGAKKDSKDSEGNTPLHGAAQKGHAEAARELIDAGASLDARNNFGMTPLMYAVLSGKNEMIRYMVDKGASVTAKDASGWTPLVWACRGRNLEAVNFLIAKGSPVNNKGNDGMTPLVMAKTGRKADEKIVASLEKAGDLAGPDHDAAVLKFNLFFAASGTDLKKIQSLIDKKAPLNFHTFHGATPLHMAAAYGNTAIIKALVKGGAKIDARDDNGATPLHWAALSGSLMAQTDAIIETLISAGADINARDNKGRTPLMDAAGDYSNMLALLNAGADVTPQNHLGMNALMYNYTFTDALKEKGIDINAMSKKGITALMLASGGEDIDAVRNLLNYGADPDMKSAKGSTALTFAAVNDRDDIVKLLLRRGAAPNWDSHCLLGMGMMKKRQYGKALEFFHKAEKIRETSPLLNQMGLAHFRLKQYDKAMNFFTRAIAKNKENPEPYFHLACLYGVKNNRKEAVSWLTKSAQKGYSNLFLLENHEGLKGIRKSNDYISIVGHLRKKYQ